MGDVKCPKCRAEKIRTVHVIRREEVVAVFPYCDACGWVVGQAVTSMGADRGGIDGVERLVYEQACSLAHFEPRDRLPTPDERQALEAKHGPRAGWMARVKGDEVFHPIRGSRVWDERGGDADGWAQWYWLNAGSVESYPHVDGRPVGWP